MLVSLVNGVLVSLVNGVLVSRVNGVFVSRVNGVLVSHVNGVLVSRVNGVLVSPINGMVVCLQDTEFDVQGLYEDNEYMFRVAAVNENGCGEWLEADSPIVAKLSFGKILHQNNAW